MELISVLGSTGSGKSTQAKLIANNLGYSNISTGELLRREHDAHLEAVMNSGQLVDSNVVQRVLSAHLKALPEGHPGVVLDGFPRLLSEAQWFERYLAEHHLKLRGVVWLKITKALAASRGQGRGRSDDSHPTFEVKWGVYEQQIMPVGQFYRDQGMIIEVDAAGPPEAITADILSKL